MLRSCAVTLFTCFRSTLRSGCFAGKYAIPFRLLLLLIWLGAGSYRVQGAEQEIKDYLPNAVSGVPLAAGSAFTVADGAPAGSFDPATWTIRNRVSLRVFEEKYIGFAFTASVRVNINYVNKDGTTGQYNDVVLQVSYDPARGTQYDAEQYRSFQDARSVTVTVQQVSANPTTGTGFLRLQNILNISRDYYFNTATTPTLLSAALVPPPTGQQADELLIRWQPAAEATTHYDLEWAWIDEEAKERYKTNGTYDAALLFHQNMTRVTLPIDKTEYRVPLLYSGQGYVFYRLRLAQLKIDGSRLEGNWATGTDPVTIGTGHEEAFNWQATTSYAEDGKRKTVITYFDGTLRSRQTVTKDNSSKSRDAGGQEVELPTTVVAETKYDYQGRPVIQVLPAPTLSTLIEYSRNFNVIKNPYTGLPAGFDKSLYDLAATCEQGAPALDNSSGAANYYSAQNPRAQQGVDRYVPDAEGYPFTETRYDAANIGEIAAQSGVGPVHQIGKGHDTRYYYDHPAQNELDGLFGTDAGLAEHYFKNLVQDANGQFSISYTDMYGRTVATALAGSSPAALQALPSNNSQAQQQLRKNLLTANHVTDRQLESMSSIVVPTSTMVHFDYQLTPEVLQLNNCNNNPVCYDCVYDLEVVITNGCDNKGLVDNVGYVAGRGYVRKEYNITLADYLNTGYNRCSPSGTAASRSFDVRFAAAGEYLITKRLILKKAAQDRYRELYLTNNTCRTIGQYTAEIQTLLNNQQSSCPTTCQQCLTALGGSATAYINNTVSQHNLTLTPELQAQLQANYQSLLEECNQLCQQPTDPEEVAAMRRQLLADLMPPNGQYARLNTTGSTEEALDEQGNTLPAKDYTALVYNIFSAVLPSPSSPAIYPLYRLKQDQLQHTGIFYQDAAGGTDRDIHPVDNYDELNSTSADQFASRFKDSWATTLLRFHPEYQRLKYVEDNLLPSYRFSDQLNRTETFAGAVTQGWISSNGDFNLLLNADPFFQAGAVGNSSRSGMLNKCVTYLVNNSVSPNQAVDMWTVAIKSVYCSSSSSFPCAAGPTSLNDLVNGAAYCDADRDKVWQAFRGLYLSHRSGLIHALVRHPSRTDARFNQLISTEYNTYYYVERFRDIVNPPPAHILPPSGVSPTVFATGQLQQQQQLIVEGYAERWRQQLSTLSCLSTAQVDAIILDLKSICASSFDDAHPLGASSRKSGDATLPQSFEEAIRSRLPNGGNSPYTATCHPYVIDWPKPYDRPQATSAEVVDRRPDDCVCNRLAELQRQAIAAGYDATCLDVYLLNYYQVSISKTDLARLEQACAAGATCRSIDPPVSLPAILQCEVVPSQECVSCGSMDDYRRGFPNQFPAYSGAPYLEPASEEEIAANQLFATYLNSILGFSKSWQEYIAFFKQCAFPPLNATATSTNLTGTACPYDPQIRLCRGAATPTLIVEAPDPCRDNEELATANATYLYQQEQLQLQDGFDSKYQDKCLQGAGGESFTATYQLSQYHYTLYYYDQAGNLVQTVPPAGVEVRVNDNSFLDGVRQARQQGSVQRPAHALLTRYLYNSLNQVVYQQTPDGGQSRFYYDYLGRLVASQNAQQATSGAYSYTGYDPLGRITEVGEKVNGAAISQAVAQDAGQLSSWMSSGSLRQITRTVYDRAYAPFGNPPIQARNLRNRVAYSYVADVADGSQFRTGTFYSYDIHGNVDVLLQYYRQGVMFAAGNAFKRVEYRYDLVSGKVNEVAYQPGQLDGFYHRYHYDAENRLTGAESSRDRLLWQQDAAYRYYRHGPLARTQLGQLNVQGIDYAYTLQGWLKGVNSSQIGKGGSAYYDMGGDDGSSISRTAKDVYSYSLHYYDDAGRSDYRPIGRAVVPAPFSNFEQVGGSVSSPLYNGNIAAMGVQIDYGAGGGGQGTGLREPLLYAYRYDQLHRLVGMQAHRNLVNNQWRPVALDDYREWVSYDANGNIRSYDRNGTTTAYGTPVAGHALEMDRLSYGYTEVSLNGRQVLTSNRLRHVKDQVSDANRYTEDIDNQADDNYSYDAIGNLVRDQQGGNEEIRWTVYGKIAGINKTDGTKVYYSYDASGNRISKTVDRSGSTNPSAGVTTTWYVRDAQGNVLSTYEKRGSSPLEQTELHLYGSSRLGIQRTGGLVVEGSLVSLYTYSTETLVRGRKLYELSNHLGNVLATITDKKVLVSDGGSVGGTGGVCADGGLVEVLDVYNRDGALSSYRARQEINFYSNFESGSSDEWEGYIDAGATSCDNNGGGGGTGSGMPAGAYYVADLVSATDYAPFGMGLLGRTYNAGAYKYGFNGQERSTEIDDNSYTAEFWEYDSRIGRRWNVDPVIKHWESSYLTFKANPIGFSDPDGDDPDSPSKPGEKRVQLNAVDNTGLAPNGDLILMGGKGKKITTVSTNLGTEQKADFRITYFDVEGQNGGWSWNNDKRSYVNSKGEEFSNGLTTAIFNKLGMGTGTNLSEAFQNLINGEPLKDTRQAYSQYKSNGGDGAVPGFVLNGIKTSISNWKEDMSAGGNRSRDAWISLWSFSSHLAQGESFVGSGATLLSKADAAFTQSTGGLKQWFRIGPSYSVYGKFKTYGLRWGASPKYANKIGNDFLREINQKFRKLKFPGNSWRTADKGHLHFWKK